MYRHLKIVVAIMSSLLLIGLAVAIYGIKVNFQKASIPAEEVILQLEEKSHIQGMAQFDDYMAIHVENPTGKKIIFFNPKNGKIAYTVKIK